MQNSKLVMELQSYGFSDVLLLTATPLQNSIEELWSLLNLLDPQKFQYRSLHGHAMSCLNDDHLTLMLLDWLRVSCRVVPLCVLYVLSTTARSSRSLDDFRNDFDDLGQMEQMQALHGLLRPLLVDTPLRVKHNINIFMHWVSQAPCHHRRTDATLSHPSSSDE